MISYRYAIEPFLRGKNVTPLRRNWFHILLAISRGACHGYAIRKEVLEHTGGELTLWPATLYGALQDMVDAGLLEGRDAADGPLDRERRDYALTTAGAEALAAEAVRLRHLADLAQRAAGAGG